MGRKKLLTISEGKHFDLLHVSPCSEDLRGVGRQIINGHDHLERCSRGDLQERGYMVLGCEDHSQVCMIGTDRIS